MHGNTVALKILNLKINLKLIFFHLKKVFLSNLKPIIEEFLDRCGGEGVG